MFTLAKTLDDTLKIFVVGATGKSFETFLEAFSESGRAAREVIAEIAAFRADLVGGIEQRDTNNADGEGKHKFEGRAHAEASERDERISDNVPAPNRRSCGSSDKLATGWDKRNRGAGTERVKWISEG